LPDLDDINHDFNTWNALQRHIQSALVRFDTMFKEVENRVDAVYLWTSSCEESILNRVSTKFAANVTQQMNNISSYATSTMTSLKNQLQETFDNHLRIHNENIATMQQTNSDQLNATILRMEQKFKQQAELLETQFYQRCDHCKEVAIQEINDCVDDATDKFNQHVDDATERFNKHVEDTMHAKATLLSQQQTVVAAPTKTTTPTSSRWSNVDPAYCKHLENLQPTEPFTNSRQFAKPPQKANVDSNPVFTTDTRTQRDSTNWDKDGPSFQPVEYGRISSSLRYHEENSSCSGSRRCA
jgi:hypothetical protein